MKVVWVGFVVSRLVQTKVLLECERTEDDVWGINIIVVAIDWLEMKKGPDDDELKQDISEVVVDATAEMP